jgi:hypothetical protein
MIIDTIRERWELAGNDHLLNHIRKRIGANPLAYGQPASYLAMRNSTAPNANASPEFIAKLKALAAAKNSWVHQMRSLDQGQGVLTDIQKRTWHELIAEAEATDAEIPF